MDKSVLLVLWCLQAFLLITAFTSTDAAALVTDDPLRFYPKETAGKEVKSNILVRRGCKGRPGGCGLLIRTNLKEGKSIST
ncbi:hypothetical protein PFLUV_G00134230 [Perca fluviatilis]|uniref:Uncharacterized protein n=1 Tax=Perca fluviatilis TaxID=8168 RepID=A0A6A5E4H2_PERFL|nr:hypothetical protein PFLUV_G00134230 [Perca fluviatilis]